MYTNKKKNFNMNIQSSINALPLAQSVVALLDEKKAEDIILLDVTKKANFADYMIIASGNVARQVAAMGDHVSRFGKDRALSPHVEGMEVGEWVLVDLGDVIVHLFKHDVRDRYSLEKMWGE